MKPNTFHVGDKAVFDSFAGLVPCTVTSVYHDRNGNPRVVAKVNKAAGPYPKGEEVDSSPQWIVPKAHVRRKACGAVIIPGFQWEAVAA